MSASMTMVLPVMGTMEVLMAFTPRYLIVYLFSGLLHSGVDLDLSTPKNNSFYKIVKILSMFWPSVILGSLFIFGQIRQ